MHHALCLVCAFEVLAGLGFWRRAIRQRHAGFERRAEMRCGPRMARAWRRRITLEQCGARWTVVCLLFSFGGVWNHRAPWCGPQSCCGAPRRKLLARSYHALLPLPIKRGARCAPAHAHVRKECLICNYTLEYRNGLRSFAWAID